MRTPDKQTVEAYWKSVRDSGTLKSLVNRGASRIPMPDWNKLRAAAALPGSRRISVRSLGFVGAAAAALLLFFGVGPGHVLLVPESPDPLVLEQVLQTSASWSDPWNQNASTAKLDSPSAVLSSIDDGLEQWNEEI